MARKRMFIIPLFALMFFLVLFNFDKVQEFFAVQPLAQLGFYVLIFGMAVALTPIGYKMLKAYLISTSKRRPLNERECRKIAIDYVKKNVLSQGAAEHDLNIISQRFDGDSFDNPYGYFAVTTEKFPGTKKVRMDEVAHDKLFVIYIDRLNGIPSYMPDVNADEDANTRLNELRLNALSYDKVRKLSEIEKLVQEEEAKGFGQKKGSELAEKKK